MAEREGKTTRRVIVALLACALIYFMLRGQVIMTGQAKSSGGARPYSGNSPHSEPKDSNAGPLSAHIEQIIFDHHQVLSREYSFKWNKTKLQPRTATVSALQKEMSNMLGVTFDDDTAVTSVRFEYAFQKFAKTCGIPQKGITMRVRDYMQGDRAGYRTVDLKANASPASKDQAHTPEIEDSIEHIVRLPFDLAPQFKDHLVINKLEEGRKIRSIPPRQPSHRLTLHSVFCSPFRLPSLHEQIFSRTSLFISPLRSAGDLCRCRSPLPSLGGQEALQSVGEDPTLSLVGLQGRGPYYAPSRR